MLFTPKNLEGIDEVVTFVAKRRSVKTVKGIVIALVVLFTLGGGTVATAASAGLAAEVSEIAPEIRITIHGQSVRVQNAAKEILYVYNLTGQCIASHRIESDDKTVNLDLPKSIYILKVGKVVRKVSIK